LESTTDTIPVIRLVTDAFVSARCRKQKCYSASRRKVHPLSLIKVECLSLRMPWYSENFSGGAPLTGGSKETLGEIRRRRKSFRLAPCPHRCDSSVNKDSVCVFAKISSPNTSDYFFFDTVVVVRRTVVGPRLTALPRIMCPLLSRTIRGPPPCQRW
jgi:hypothetical protein